MRIWLGAAFAAVGVITAASVYLFVSDSSEHVISDRSTELAVGRTVTLADQVGQARRDPGDLIAGAQAPGFRAWFFDSSGKLVAPVPGGPALQAIPVRNVAVRRALQGERYSAALAGDQTAVAVRVMGPHGATRGVVLGRYSNRQVLQGAVDQIRSDSFRALLIAVAIGILAGALVATLIAVRVKRLAESAKQMSQGEFDAPLLVSGSDEIGDLARALDSMRASLKESFGVLTADRDKLAAIFDGLTDAVVVVDDRGSVRFHNGTADELLEDGAPPEAMRTLLERASSVGFAAHPALRIGDRAYAVEARALPAENAVLAVARDRTDEMRREFAERDFVSNAAHELRNPLAGISGAIEVLRDGAKDDPEARDHFLTRLAEDSDRMGRLIQSLLILARIEALGPGEVEVVDVAKAVDDAVDAVQQPRAIKLHVDVEPDLTAQGDPTMLRQVLIGLIGNAYKNTPPPGAVTVRGRRVGDSEVFLEVTDTGTGIPASELERVFERFYRRSEARKQEGFGLGLAIARRMVSVMGGRIGASSVEGEGSTFWVRLPLARTTATPVA